MLSRILLISLAATSLTGCPSAPVFPDIQECRPVVIRDPVTGQPNWNASYAFCVSHADPNNPDLHSRIQIHEFIIGENHGKKPLMFRSPDEIKLRTYEIEVKSWGERNCKQDKE